LDFALAMAAQDRGRAAEAGRTQLELQYGKALLPSPGHPDDVGKRVI
jgi:hypothetical protein